MASVKALDGGDVTVYQLESGDEINMGDSIDTIEATLDGRHVILNMQDGGTVILQNFVDAVINGDAPILHFEEGNSVGGDLLIQQLTSNDSYSQDAVHLADVVEDDAVSGRVGMETMLYEQFYNQQYSVPTAEFDESRAVQIAATAAAKEGEQVINIPITDLVVATKQGLVVESVIVNGQVLNIVNGKAVYAVTDAVSGASAEVAEEVVANDVEIDADFGGLVVGGEAVPQAITIVFSDGAGNTTTVEVEANLVLQEDNSIILELPVIEPPVVDPVVPDEPLLDTNTELNIDIVEETPPPEEEVVAQPEPEEPPVVEEPVSDDDDDDDDVHFDDDDDDDDDDVHFDDDQDADGDSGNLILGTDGKDVLHGTDEADTIKGFGDQDHLKGGDGDDILIGGEGRDHLMGEGGDDLLIIDEFDFHVDGGEGTDTIQFEHGGEWNLHDIHANHIERIDMHNGEEDSLLLTGKDIRTVSDTDSLLVKGEEGDSIQLTGTKSVTVGESVEIDGTHYTSFEIDGKNELLVEEGVAVVDGNGDSLI